MALGRTYRFVVYNATGQTLGSNSVVITARRWSFNSSGVMTWEGSEASIDSLSTITTASYATGTTIDNSSTAYLGGTFKFTVIAPASSSGPVVIYLQRSTDGGSTWPDNGQGDVVQVFGFTTSGTKVNEKEI